MPPTIRLVPFAETHLDATYRWIGDPQVRHGLIFNRMVTPAQHRDWYHQMRADPSQRIFGILAGDGHIGNFGYRSIQAAHRRADLWMYFGTEGRGRGLGHAALAAGLTAGFGPLALRKIALTVRPDNAAALRLYEAAGFEREGLLRAEFIHDGAPVDVIRMGLLAPLQG